MADEQSVIDTDKMLGLVGDFGRYQWCLMFMFSVINVLSAFHYFGQTFISLAPENFQCLVPEDDHVIDSTQCSYTVFENGNRREIPCTAWIYHNHYNYTSIVQQKNWVCEDAWKPALSQSLFFIGSVVGTLVFGVLADLIGRLQVLIAANMMAFLGNILTLFSRDFPSYVISRFIAGCATDANFIMMYIIVMEYIRPSMRTFGLNICIGVFYCLGCMVMPWIALGLNQWEHLMMVIALPHFATIMLYFVVPESAQWLISKGKIKTAISRYQWIAKRNNKKIDEKYYEALKRYSIETQTKSIRHESFLDLLKTPKLRKKTLILIFKSMVMTLCYDAISRNVNGLGYSPFLVFTITSATIFPACLFILAVQDRVGRKALACGALLLSGIFSAASGFVLHFIERPDTSLLVILAIIARFGINVAYNSGAQYAVELIPTVVRGQGVSVVHVLGYAASFFSPQILFLEKYWTPAPETILGFLLISGAFACLFLPETTNKTLPVTLQEGEDFGEDETIFDFACCQSATDSTTQLTA